MKVWWYTLSLLTASLSTKLEVLIDNRRRSDGKRFSNSDIAKRTNLSKTYVQKLRTDPTVSPTLKVIEKLAHFFGVNPLFFSSDPEFYIPPVPNQEVLAALAQLRVENDDEG